MQTFPMRLNCTRCGTFRDWWRESENVVRCDQCDKRHSDNSLHVIDPEKRYERDEAGNLLEETP